MLGFIIAVIAGFLTPHLEAPVGKPVAKAIEGFVELEAGETRLFSFIVAMLIAGVLCALFDTGSPLGVMLGGAIGYFYCLTKMTLYLHCLACV